MMQSCASKQVSVGHTREVEAAEGCCTAAGGAAEVAAPAF